eukprot:jgi/Bigna1/131921/aug1.15_g6629
MKIFRSWSRPGKRLGAGIRKLNLQQGQKNEIDSSQQQYYELDDYGDLDSPVKTFLQRIYGVDKVDAYGRLLWKDFMAEGEIWNGNADNGENHPSLFTYGEVLPESVPSLMEKLDIVSTFLELKNLIFVLVFVRRQLQRPMIVRKTPERLLATTPMARTLEFRKGDIADLVHVTQAMNPAIVLFNVCHNPELLLHFKSFFQALKSGTRIVTYENLFTLWRDEIEENPPFEAINIGDRFFTTWERNEGHDFYMWRKL